MTHDTPAAPPRPPPTDSDFSQRVAFTYMIGVYVAINAISDLYLLVEGPDCSYMKTQYVQGNHDWLSTVTSVSGFHRIANTALHPSQMSGSRENGVLESLLRIAERPAVPAVALTSMPMAFITGADYERLSRIVMQRTGKMAVHIPGKSLSGDWLDGYAEVLLALANQMDLSGGTLDPNKVGIVGYLFDRNEEDHGANLRELRRMVEALGLDLGAVWLSGSRFQDLAAVRDCGTVLSLPYGRKAARQVARRTGAKLVEMDLPFGLDACERWMRTLGQVFAREPQAHAFVEQQLAAVVPKLEWVIPFVFQGRSVGFVGDPHLLPGFAEITTMLGARLRYAIVTNRPMHAKGLQSHLPGVQLCVHPRMKQLMRFVLKRPADEKPDLLVTNNIGIAGSEAAVLEFGFPSGFRHALYDRPFFGFAGALAFIDDMANAMRMHEVELARRALLSGVGSARPMSGH